MLDSALNPKGCGKTWVELGGRRANQVSFLKKRSFLERIILRKKVFFLWIVIEKILKNGEKFTT